MKKNLFDIKKSNFLEGSFIATLSIIVTKIMGMLYVIPFYAMVGVKGSALYAYAYNVYIIFLDISSAGIPISMSKLIKQYHTLGLHEAKIRAYKIAQKLTKSISIIMFLLTFFFAKYIALLILGNLKGGNTIEEVALVIRFIALAILVIPRLSIMKGYLQGLSIINISSYSQVIEQAVRISIILLGSYLCIYIFHLRLDLAVGFCVLGAFVGGICSILYIQAKMRKKKEELFPKLKQKDNVSNKEIMHKLITYAIPFILIDMATSIYNFIDMVLLSRTMTHLGYSGAQTEFITSSVATWSSKIGMVITSIAMGIIVSLIPSIVEACTLKKWDLVEDRINKSIQLVLIICIPMIIGISLLSRPIWNIFYGTEYLDLGAMVLKFSIFSTLPINLYMISTSSLQSMSKVRGVYKSTFLGYMTNLILDIPFMFFFHAISLPPFLGALLSSILGYSLSFFSSLYTLKKQYDLKYKESLFVFVKVICSTLIMAGLILLIKDRIIYDETNKISTILYVFLLSLIGLGSYLLCLVKVRILQPRRKKLTLKKVSPL